MLGLVHARTLRAAGNSDLADQIMSYSLLQLNFVLGDGGRSWLVGFGKNAPQLAFQKTAWNSYLTWFTKGQSTEIQRADFQVITGMIIMSMGICAHPSFAAP